MTGTNSHPTHDTDGALGRVIDYACARTRIISQLEARGRVLALQVGRQASHGLSELTFYRRQLGRVMAALHAIDPTAAANLAADPGYRSALATHRPGSQPGKCPACTKAPATGHCRRAASADGTKSSAPRASSARREDAA